MSVGRPFTAKWPWQTSWRAWAREVAKPIRNTTLSSRSSSMPQEVLAGDARPGIGRLEVVLELALEDGVDAADLLLLAQLHAVLADLAAADAVLAGRGGPALEGALLRVAAAALQEELGALPAAEAADGTGVAGHGRVSWLRPGAAWGRGSRCGGWG